MRVSNAQTLWAFASNSKAGTHQRLYKTWWREAQARVKQRRDLRRETSGNILAMIIVETMDRHHVERAYAAYNNGVRPPLEDQLSNTCLRTQFKEIAAGRVCHMFLQQMN